MSPVELTIGTTMALLVLVAMAAVIGTAWHELRRA